MRAQSENPWDNCLFKHYVRRIGWHPACEARKDIVKSSLKKTGRRIRYFTFCAQNATDVVMLEIEKIVSPNNKTGEFDNVVFFDHDRTALAEIRKVVPGAIGYPARFESVMLHEDFEDERNIDAPAVISASTDGTYSETVRKSQEMEYIRADFLNRFPFDIINLDLCGYLFPQNDHVPGKIITSMRKLFRHQRRKLVEYGKDFGQLDGFTLMLTAQVGPAELSQEHVNLLVSTIENNFARKKEFRDLYEEVTNEPLVTNLVEKDFELFFKIAIPKLIASELLAEDWYVEAGSGIDVYEFQREYDEQNNTYTMLHFVMQVKRQKPSKDNRAANSFSPDAAAAYDAVVERIFRGETIKIEGQVIERHRENLQPDLDLLTKIATDRRA